MNGRRKVARGTHHVARWNCDGWSGASQRAYDQRRRKSCSRGAPSFSLAAPRTAPLPATFPGSSWRCRFAQPSVLLLLEILQEIETLRSDRRSPSPAAEDEEVESPFSCLNPPPLFLLPSRDWRSIRRMKKEKKEKRKKKQAFSYAENAPQIADSLTEWWERTRGSPPPPPRLDFNSSTLANARRQDTTFMNVIYSIISARSTHRRKKRGKRNQLTGHKQYDIRSTPRASEEEISVICENKITHVTPSHLFSPRIPRFGSINYMIVIFSLMFETLLFDNIISLFERSCRRYGHDRCLNIRHVTYAWRNAVAREASSPPTYRLRNTSRGRRASATVRFPGARRH